jgi:copper chaperone CopZ
MHCESCVNRISESLSKLPGVQDLEVTLDPQQAVVQTETRLHRSVVENAVAQAGNYKVVDAVESANGIPSRATQPVDAPATPAAAATYYPLMLVLGFILLGTSILQWRAGTWSSGQAMSDFMGCFFVVFAFFKLLDLNGFAGTFSRYDLVAARSKVYAKIYPFLELALGVAYLVGRHLFWVNIATLVLMTVGSLGVIVTLRRWEQIQCACLGTVIQLPMSTVTLIEDAGMALMAAIMLAM